MYPTLEKIKEIAQSGEYRRIPVCRELYSDRYTPVEFMRTLRTASRHCYLLESASQTEVWGRYSFLGYEPSMEITCTDGKLQIRMIHEDGTEEKTVQQVKHPGDAIREILKEYKSPVLENMPTFTGGLVGYFSYDYIKYSEPKLELTDETVQDFRDMDLMLFDQVIAFDHYRQKVLLITGVMTDDPENSYQKAEVKLKEMADLIRNGKQKEFPSLKLKSSIEPQFPKEKYCEMVEKAKHYIHEGDIFQVVLSNPMRAKAEGSLFDTYRVLRATNPSPYMFYFSSDDMEIAGASPETLVKLENTAADVCSVFEGFMDFLSAVTLGLATGDCLVLNSVANVEKALKHLDGYERIDCYLDRDEAGRRAMEALRTRYGGKVTDRSGIYQGCKDLNEYLQQVSRKQQKNNNLKIKE